MEEKALNILVVEDDEFVRILLKETFSFHWQNPYNIFFADNVKSAEKMLDEIKPSLVFLDLGLPMAEKEQPKTDGGFILLEKIKKDENLKHSKVVVFSGFGDEEIQKKAKEMGADEFLKKGEYLPHEIIKLAFDATGQKQEALSKI